MRTLAIDTANLPLAVALAEHGQPLVEYNSDLKTTHSVRLMPVIERCLQDVGWKAKDLDAIFVSRGPGSYTGVRIGVTTAKTLAWTLGIPLVGLSSLQIIAQNGLGRADYVMTLIDARRGQAYRGLYHQMHKEQAAEILTPFKEEGFVDVAEELKQLDKVEGSILFLGSGAEVNQELLQQALGNRARFGQVVDHLPRGFHIMNLGQHYWEQRVEGEAIHQFAPEYLRLAEAEANWIAQQGGQC